MAKLRDDPVTSSDLTEYLASQDDLALELYVYSTARSLGLSATHGGTYEDPVTKKPRQYDIRAHGHRKARRIDLAIECKSLGRNFPLLLSRIGRLPEESFHEFIYSHKPRTDTPFVARELVPARSVTVRGADSLYPPHEYVGKSTAQVGRNDKGDLVSGDGEVFDKWSQALASAEELISDSVYAYRNAEEGVQVTAVLPALVVSDETLWIADYSDEGLQVGPPTQVDEALIYLGREYYKPMSVCFTVSHLHVYTKRGVRHLLEHVANDDAFWERVFPLEAIKRGLLGGV